MAKVGKKIKLTSKQQDFVNYYCVGETVNNGMLSAIKAGYSEKTATVIAYENLTKPYIAKAIEEKKAVIAKKLEVNEQELTKRFNRLAQTAESEGNLQEARLNNRELGQHIGYYEADNRQRQAKTAILIENNADRAKYLKEQLSLLERADEAGNALCEG